MFRGDHPDLSRTVGRALKLARDLGHPRTGSEHLLLALTAGSTVTRGTVTGSTVTEGTVTEGTVTEGTVTEGTITGSNVTGSNVTGSNDAVASILAAHGATEAAIREAVHRAAPAGAGAAADRDALAGLGIDLDRLLGASGAAALDRPPVREPLFPLGAAKARRRCARMRPPLGLDAQAAYEASLRLALSRRERDHRPEHLALALITLDPGVAWVLSTAGIDRQALLADLAAAFPPPRRNPLLNLERRLARRTRHRDIVRRYQHTTGRTTTSAAALATLIGRA
ncbi:Clp protease N-terminal domain-containing protein [Planobispora siamensis]|uniref:Peptidase n=1 Tax=Planobispora siamensis TaxID=936338 RepID=A0A8J3SJL5_9ACTN|nr:Clp protease N-terminal domain-containing protein [Planobispora siamensis]GIH95603.1 peptidase [Planobispora siamensis]